MESVISPAIAEDSVRLNKSRKSVKLAFLVPFFLGAALFLSVVFSPVASLPLIFVSLRYGRVSGVIASITNLALVFFLSGRVNSALFFVSAVVLGLVFSECLRYKVRLEFTALLGVGVMALISGLLLVSYSLQFKINPIQKLDSFVGSVVNHVASNVEKYKESSAISTQDLEKFLVDPETTKKNIMYELPSAFAIALFALSVGNLLLLLRLNLAGVRKSLKVEIDFFKNWRAPDHLVWPTLLAGFCLVIELPVVSDVALNLFKVFMAVYALQGLAILNYLFDLWGVKGFFRPMGYVLAVAILLPLVISMGFFDLWFGFREKMKR